MRVLAPIFENLYQSLTGKKVQDFYFYQRDGTINQDLPLYNFWTVVSIYIGYYVVIFGLQRIMKGFQPIRFKNTVIVHNIFLSAMSLALLLMIVERLISPITEHGLFYAVCSADMWKDRGLELLYYINYLFKYYELLDTVFLVLAKKDLEFLHVYHHGMTLWLTWTQIAGNTSVQWVPIVLNLAVHVLMYYYYARAAMGAQIWWKKYLTTFQIVQFFIDLWFVFYCSYHVIMRNNFDSNHKPYCHGTTAAAISGTSILVSYFFLFIHFFIKTYSRPRPASQKKKQ